MILNGPVITKGATDAQRFPLLGCFVTLFQQYPASSRPHERVHALHKIKHLLLFAEKYLLLLLMKNRGTSRV